MKLTKTGRVLICTSHAGKTPLIRSVVLAYGCRVWIDTNENRNGSKRSLHALSFAGARLRPRVGRVPLARVSSPRPMEQHGVGRIKIFLALIQFTLALGCEPAFAQQLQEIRIGSSAIGFSSLTTYLARDFKFFEKEGLDAKIIYVATNVGLAALAAGNVDYTTLITSAAEAALRGLPLRLVAATNVQPLWGVVVRKEINNISDLKGKKLGVSSFGGTSYSAALYILKQYGLKPQEDVVILAVGDTAGRLAALQHGTVHAAIIPAPGDMRAEQEGFKILMDAGSIYKLPNGGTSTTVAKIKQNPAEVRKVVRAMVGVTRFVMEPQNKPEIVKYIARVFNLNPVATEQFYNRFVPTLSRTGMVDMDKIKLIVDDALARGIINKPVDPETLVDYSFVKGL